MAANSTLSLSILAQQRINDCTAIRADLQEGGIYRTFQNSASDGTDPNQSNDLWRIATSPYPLSKEETLFLKSLGKHLLTFYEASNRLYYESLNGLAPPWVAAYLNIGKPESVTEYARMNRFKRDLPQIIRPDLIPTETGMIATELDAVPGGMGQTAALSAAYHATLKDGASLVGGQDGMVIGFERMIRAMSDNPNPFLVIVVSEESKSYRPEMLWLTKALKKRGLLTVVVIPKSVIFTEEGLWVEVDGEKRQVDVLYRFFELFDLKNIPKSELMLYAAKKKQVILTPPAKAHLEEKSLFALFHHPELQTFWHRHLGAECHEVLQEIFPKTWIMDPTEVPPHALIPDLMLSGHPLSDFRQLGKASKKEREFAIKPSGFSELAWGSRGVSVGHDLSEKDWQVSIDHALARFKTTPYILQEFHKGKKLRLEYYHFEKDQLIEMEGRARLSPYYFIEGKEAHLAGVLATVCSLEKKLIHGMVDAIMAPCSVSLF